VPLLDHFRMPLSVECPCETLHSTWAVSIANQLNNVVMPREYLALPETHRGQRVEIDVSVHERLEARPTHGNGNGNGAVVVWAPPEILLSTEVAFADEDLFEIKIRDQNHLRLVAAVELISPSNKDRPESRRAFAVKCASYLQQKVSLVLVDVNTERQSILHEELMELLQMPESFRQAVTSPLHTVAYHILEPELSHFRMDLWYEPLQLGSVLPTMPLWVSADLAFPLDLETTYRAALRVQRLDHFED
jgi:hypothetical protein